MVFFKGVAERGEEWYLSRLSATPACVFPYLFLFSSSLVGHS